MVWQKEQNRQLNKVSRNFGKGLLKIKLHMVSLTYRNTPQSTTGNSPAKLLFGRKFKTRFDQLKPDLFTKVQKNQQKQNFSHDNHDNPCEQCRSKVVTRENRKTNWSSVIPCEIRGRTNVEKTC